MVCLPGEQYISFSPHSVFSLQPPAADAHDPGCAPPHGSAALVFQYSKIHTEIRGYGSEFRTRFLSP